MHGRMKRPLWRRCSAARRTCGRSTAPSLRQTRMRSSHPIRQSLTDACGLPSTPSGGVWASPWCCPSRAAGASSTTCSSSPIRWGVGVGRLLVDDVATRAAAAGASHVDVIANPNAMGFYERLGFEITGQASTRFGDAPRMSLELSP